jgi:predicted DNA binding CopG/RHH family protein
MEAAMNQPKLPQTDSIQELAQFWDTHDLTDFEDQLEEVTEPVFERSSLVKVQFEEQDIERVKEVARIRGIQYTDLIREWVLEKVHSAECSA